MTKGDLINVVARAAKMSRRGGVWHLLGKIAEGKNGKESSDRRSNQYQGQSHRGIQTSPQIEKGPLDN